MADQSSEQAASRRKGYRVIAAEIKSTGNLVSGLGEYELANRLWALASECAARGLTMSDRGRDTSIELSEVRTVLSRAEHALWVVEGTRPYAGRDPDSPEITAALQEVIGLLDRWRRTGRPLKSK
jgi:hypothetical protein